MGADQPVDLDLLLTALRSACRSHRNIEPEDIMGEVYLRLDRVLSKDPSKFRSVSHFIAYVHLVVDRLLIEDHRRTKRQAQVVDPILLHNEATSNRAETSDRPSPKECLDALNATDPETREAFRLHLEGFQGKAIAVKLGADPSKVSRLLTRARVIIKVKFPEYGRADDSERSDP